jgi:hypothetical protein
MPTIATIVRKTAPEILRQFFDARGVELPEVPWDGKKSLAKPIMAAIEGLDSDLQGRITNDAGRVGALADEAGQAAIYSVVADKTKLDELANGYEQAMWLLLNEPKLFLRAEEARYTDERRRGKHWDGFLAEPETPLNRDEAAIQAFMDAIRDRFGSKNVHVDIFDRQRSSFDGEEHILIQATIYSEGRSVDYLQFVNGALDVRNRRPVIEACLTYEPKSGTIEAVAADRPAREEYVRIFARDLLGIPFEEGERMPLRRFDLQGLLQEFDFPTDARDGVAAVRVNSLRLMPFDTVRERVTIECLSGVDRTIWEVSADRFGDNDPLADGGWMVTQARLSIQFHPEPGGTRGKVLPVTLTMPHGSDLKDRTDRERLIGEKYLRKWRLLKDV